MKMKIWLPLLFAIMALTYCSKAYIFDPPPKTEKATFSFTASLPYAQNQTKTVSITRYILEIYKASDPSVRIERVEQISNTIVASLEANTKYICLFWADEVALDDNANGTFNALDLKNVTLNTGKHMTEAFFTRLDITDATTTFNVTLKRALARVNMIATEAVTANADLMITFNQYRSFNTSTSEIIGTTVASSRTFNSSVTRGTLGTFLTFASASGILTNLTTLYNSAVTNEITNVPLKTNYATNIHGDYTIGAQDFALDLTEDKTLESVIASVEINLGTTANPKWIEVADRNAMKGGTYGATAGATAFDYGYYYQWSDETDDPSNADKAFRACFDFGEGNGIWRLPTFVELGLIAGNSGRHHNVDVNRKLKWDGGPAWKLYDERAGKETQFVYFPMAGHINSNYGSIATHYAATAGYYWTTTTKGVYASSLSFSTNGYSIMSENYKVGGFSVRCVKDI